MKYFSVFITSTVKFIFGPITGLATGLSWAETAFFTVLGMMTSVLIFTFLGIKIRTYLFRKRKKKPGKVFSKKNKLIVRIRQRFGMWGIAFLTPIIFSPIIGTLVAVSLGINKAKIILYMLICAIFWSVIISLLLTYAGGSVKNFLSY